jgi:hypothetical protein
MADGVNVFNLHQAFSSILENDMQWFYDFVLFSFYEEKYKIMHNAPAGAILDDSMSYRLVNGDRK